MISMVDSLEGLYKWKGRSDEAFKSRDRMARAHKTQPDVEAMCKYYYYLGACNAFVVADLIEDNEALWNNHWTKVKWT